MDERDTPRVVVTMTCGRCGKTFLAIKGEANFVCPYCGQCYECE